MPTDQTQTQTRTDPGPPTTVGAGSVPGLLRRVRRTADLSQRDLAALLGISQSRVARWETARSSPTYDELACVTALVGHAPAVVDQDGAQMLPMRSDAVRDRAGRMFPAHVDPQARGWWLPPGAHLTAPHPEELPRAMAAGDVRVAYDRGCGARCCADCSAPLRTTRPGSTWSPRPGPIASPP